MAFNPSPKVAVARDFAKRFGKTHVIIIALDGETLEYASYGRNQRECAEAERFADACYETLMARLAELRASRVPEVKP